MGDVVVTKRMSRVALDEDGEVPAYFLTRLRCRQAT